MTSSTMGRTPFGSPNLSRNVRILAALELTAPKKHDPMPRLSAATTIFSAMYAASCIPSSNRVRLFVTMRQPRYLSTCLLNVGVRSASDVPALTRDLAAVAGVVEVAVVADEGVAYLKVEKHVLDDEKLLSFVADKN